jgi:hypothetical protein
MTATEVAAERVRPVQDRDVARPPVRKSRASTTHWLRIIRLVITLATMTLALALGSVAWRRIWERHGRATPPCAPMW